jgi:hypothetical protein
VDADIASAEAHLLAGRPKQALALIERALSEAASIQAATLLPSAYRVQAAARLRPVKSRKLRRPWQKVCNKARQPMLRTNGASCLQ